MAPHSSTLAWKIPWTEGLVGVVHGVAKSRTRLSDFTIQYMEYILSYPQWGQHIDIYAVKQIKTQISFQVRFCLETN